MQAVDDIVAILQSPDDFLPTSLHLGDATRNEILDIATSLKTVVASPPAPASSIAPANLSTSMPTIVPELRVEKNPAVTVRESREVLFNDTEFKSPLDDDDGVTVHTSDTTHD